MAFKKIEIPDDEGTGKTYFKFTKVGDRVAGVFLSMIAESGQYKKPEYTFRVKDPATGQPAEISINPPTRLAMALEKANLKKGHKVIMTKTGERDVGKESPMGLFEVMVDDSPAPVAAAPTPVAVAAPKPKPPPPPAGDEFDDIPV